MLSNNSSFMKGDGEALKTLLDDDVRNVLFRCNSTERSSILRENVEKLIALRNYRWHKVHVNFNFSPTELSHDISILLLTARNLSIIGLTELYEAAQNATCP